MKSLCPVAVFGLFLAFGVAFPVRGMQSAAGVVEQPVPTLEFYGYSYGRDATPQLAFLRQGAQIFIAAEGDLIEDTYRVVRIGVDSAVVESTLSRQRQTLPLTAPKSQNDSAAVQPAPTVARPGLVRNSSPTARPSQAAAASAAPAQR